MIRPDSPMAPYGIKPEVHGPDEFDKEFITFNGWSWFNAMMVLHHQPDDVEREIGPDTYARMTRHPKIHKARRIIIHGTLTDDLQFAPGATEEEAASPAEYKRYQQVMHFCERVIGGLERPIWETLEQMLSGKWEQGHKIAEVTYQERLDGPTKSVTSETKKRGAKPNQGRSTLARFLGLPQLFSPPDPEQDQPRGTGLTLQPKTRWLPYSIKVKPEGAALFVVDQFRNVLGIYPAYGYRLGQTYNPAQVIDRDKFLVLTHDPEDGDPRGRSGWRPAFNDYSLDSRIPQQYLLYLIQEAMAIPVGKLPPSTNGWLFDKNPLTGEIQYESNGRPKMLEATTSMALTIKQMRGGQGVVIPSEAELTAYKGGATNGGEVFPRALEIIGNRIEEAILLQTTAQSKSERELAQSADGAINVRSDLFFWEKRCICVMLLYDLLAPSIRINVGEWALPYLPKVSLGDSEKRDWAKDLETIAKAYFYGFIDDTQRPELCAWLSLPKPGPSRMEMAQQDPTTGEPIKPTNQRPGKSQPGQPGTPPSGNPPDPNNAHSQQAQIDALMRDALNRLSQVVAQHEAKLKGNANHVPTSFSRPGGNALGHHTRRRWFSF